MRGIRHLAVELANAHLGQVGWRAIDTTHNSLVIALEEDRDEGEYLNRDVQLARRQALPKRSVPHDLYKILRYLPELLAQLLIALMQLAVPLYGTSPSFQAIRLERGRESCELTSGGGSIATGRITQFVLKRITI